METRDELMRTSRGYWGSRTLLTAVELGVFEALAGGRRSGEEVAERVGGHAPAVATLLDALVGMGVLGKTKSGYAILKPMQPYLTEGPESALGMLRHHARLWATWNELTTRVREGPDPEHLSGFQRGPQEARAFTRAMRDGSRRLAPDVAAEVSLEGRKLLLDLGGGPGTYAVAFARANPSLRVIVVDLPDVCHAGRDLVAEEVDVADRVSYHAADLEAGMLPQGADCAFLSHVIHSMDDDQVRALFVKVRETLTPDGMLVVRDFFTSPDRTQPPGASLFALNMLANSARGRSYSAKETTAWLREAAFAKVRFQRSTSVPDTGYLIAR